MIYLPPPQPTQNKDIRISGDVEVHPTASLAQGVILQAAPNCKIVISADACIGMGAIINAAQGSVEIGSGAILGAGVLIIGASKIGSNCCIGTSSTIIQANVAPMAVIEPGSILGDGSRKVELAKDTQPENKSNLNGKNASQTPNNFARGEGFANKNNRAADNKINNKTVPNKGTSSPPTVTQVDTQVDNSLSPSPQKKPVVGQVYINELLVTLFPHNKNSHSNSQNS